MTHVKQKTSKSYIKPKIFIYMISELKQADYFDTIVVITI